MAKSKDKIVELAELIRKEASFDRKGKLTNPGLLGSRIVAWMKISPEIVRPRVHDYLISFIKEPYNFRYEQMAREIMASAVKG